MRKSKQEAAETRQRIVEAASGEFRRKGIGGTGLADLMAAAGLTHGGFYKHFDSKDQVVEESLTLAAESLVYALESKLSTSSGDQGLNAAIADYLSMEHRDNEADGCPFVSASILRQARKHLTQ
jgi:TetR/AcrR family transcriptional repressor of nem operon